MFVRVLRGISVKWEGKVKIFVLAQYKEVRTRYYSRVATLNPSELSDLGRVTRAEASK